MDESLLIAFRSRTQVMRFYKKLADKGIQCQVISTPRQIAIGCGLSVQTAIGAADEARQILTKEHFTGFVGFYRLKGEWITAF